MLSLLFAHPEPLTYYLDYVAAGVLILVTGSIVLFAGRLLVGVIRPSHLRKPATTVGERVMETLEASIWAITGILIWYGIASLLITPLGLTR